VLGDSGQCLQLRGRHEVRRARRPAADTRMTCLGETLAYLFPRTRRADVEVLAGRGDGDSAAPPLDQSRAERHLEPGQDLADGGLREMHGPGRRADAAVPAQLNEHGQVAQVRQRLVHAKPRAGRYR
jgi:hypothetical protein